MSAIIPTHSTAKMMKPALTVPVATKGKNDDDHRDAAGHHHPVMTAVTVVSHLMSLMVHSLMAGVSVEIALGHVGLRRDAGTWPSLA